VEGEQIEPAPRIGTKLNTEFIKGMVKREESFIMILDIDRVFTADDLESVQIESSAS
jgi:purine-binding chemotaxis protein CheW